MLQRSVSTTAFAGAFALAPASLVVSPMRTFFESPGHKAGREFSLPYQSTRRGSTYLDKTYHHASRWGGRGALMRLARPNGRRNTYKHATKGDAWKRDPKTMQYNVDIWSAQQTLRKKWKGRDWEVFEMPFEKAPKELQRVVPEIYTEAPVMTDPKNGDFSNIRGKVFDREEMQEVLYSNYEEKPYPRLQKVKTVDEGGKKLVTLSSIF